MFLGRLGIITGATLKKRRPYAIIIFFIIGAILTPPDAISQCFLAVTLFILYELSIFLIPKKRDLEEDQEDSKEETKEALASPNKAPSGSSSGDNDPPLDATQNSPATDAPSDRPEGLSDNGLNSGDSPSTTDPNPQEVPNSKDPKGPF
jgi:hypothetical protein